MTRPRRLRRGALAAALLVCFGLGGCTETDPLEAIRQQQAVGDYEGSLEPLRELLAKSPDSPEVNYLYGHALVLTGQAHLAEWSLRKAMQDPDWLSPAGLQLAYAGLFGNNFNEAVEVTGHILEREPENATALLLRAQANAHWKKDPESALADAKRVLELNPDMIEAYEPMILALLALGRLDEAGEKLEEAGRLLTEGGAADEVLAWHCSTTAAFLHDSKEFEKERETWKRCLEAHPADLEVVSSAVGFFDAQGELDRSLEIVRAALAADPSSRVFRVGLAERLRLAGQAAEGEAVLREATEAEDPTLAAAGWLDLAKFHQAQGEQAAAADAMERALELAQEAGTANPQLLGEYADALVLAGRLDRALEIAEELPVPAHRALIRARVMQERREPARALEEFDEALRLWPDNPWARYYAALAAEELGDFQRALAEYRYSVRVSPDATDARTRGAAMLFAEGRVPAARQMLLVGQGPHPVFAELEDALAYMRVLGFLADMNAVSDALGRLEAMRPDWTGQALVAVAEGAARRGGPAVAQSVLATAPVDLGDPRYAAALRALVRFSHEAGETAEMQEGLRKILAAHPDSGALQEVRGLDLELSGAPVEAVRAAYTRALELEPGNARALAGLGRLALADDPEAALGLFDRAAAADPSDPDPKLGAARALLAAGQTDEAAQRLDALLLAHPYEAEAAAERARLDLERGDATPRTVERARRAVRFGGGVEALELLGRIHELRGEPELAAQATERARALRERRASDTEAPEGEPSEAGEAPASEAEAS